MSWIKPTIYPTGEIEMNRNVCDHCWTRAHDAADQEAMDRCGLCNNCEARKKASRFWLRFMLAMMAAALALMLFGCALEPTVPPKFQPGDVVVARGFSRHPQYQETLVVVTDRLRGHPIREFSGALMLTYEITTYDGRKFAAQEFQLRALTDAERSR